MISVVCVLVLLTLLATVVTYFKSEGELLSTLIVFVIGVVLSAFIAGGLSYIVGFYPGYSQGEKMGFVVKASTKGFLFKTNECDMQLGSGFQSSVSSHFEFSVPEPMIYRCIQAHLGDKCEIHYRQWYVMPFWMGDTDYEVTAVKYTQSGDMAASTPSN